MNDDGEDHGYGLVCPFWIDTDGYTDRDRAMFVAGAEFAGILRHLESDDAPLSVPVHRENESRIRMAAARFGRRVILTTVNDHDVSGGTWAYLEVSPR